jgi:hypothetical protein
MIPRMPLSAGANPLTAHFVWTPPLIWALLVIVAGVLIVILLRARGWGPAAFWLALAVAGQALALQLVQAGPDVRLQMFYGWSQMLHSWRLAVLLAVVLHALVVAIGIWRWLASDADARRGMSRLLTWPQAMLLLALAAYGCTSMSPEFFRSMVQGGFAKQAAIQGSKLALGVMLLFAGTANFLLVAVHLPKDVWSKLVARWERRKSARIIWGAALWVVVVSSLLCVFVLDAMPHVEDEVAYIFHAKTISLGRLWLPPPPDAVAFFCEYVNTRDKWYSAMLGGWPFVFALGFLLGAPWLINPLLGGLGVVLAHRLVKQMYGAAMADGAALLLAASPWLLFISASFMPHATSLVLMLLGLLGVERARASGSWVWGAVAGLAFGGLLHVRPLEAIAVAAVAGIWWLSAGWKNLRLPALASAVVAGLVMTALFLAYNKELTGDALYAPVNKFFDEAKYPGSNRLGFGAEVGNFGWVGMDALPGHGPLDVIFNTNNNLYLLNFELFGWAGGSLLFVALLLLWRRWREHALMWGLLFGLWAGMNLYWFSGGPDFGPRYWYQMILPCVVLTLAGAAEFARRWSAESGMESGGASRVWAFVLLATVIGFVNLAPWRALDKYPNYRGIRPEIRALARAHQFGRSLVFVRGQENPDYLSAFALNPPRVDRPAADGFDVPIFARDLGAASRERLRAYYSDRTVWIVAGHTETGTSARLVAGPIPPGAPLPDDGYVPPEKRPKQRP